MNIPANIRVNAAFPFPALVQGFGPVTISKANGIWTIGFSIDQLGQRTSATPATDFILVWDDVNNTFYKISIANLASAINAGGAARAQRLVTASPIVVAPTDQIINCNIAVTASCALPFAASRVGAPVTFHDMGQALAHPITLTASGADTIDGQPSYVLSNNRQTVTLVPFNDGTSVGWGVE